MSSWITGCSYTDPAGSLPFHCTTNGTRMPPSSVVRLEPRNGSLREPLMVVPRMVGPPLSLKKKISVFSSRSRGPERVEHLADGLVHRGEHRGVGLARVVGDRREPLQSAVGRVHRRVDRVEGEVKQERLVLVPHDKRDRFAPEGIGQVLFLLDDLRSPIDGCPLAGEVRVRAPEEAEELVEPAPRGVKPGRGAQVPLADQARHISGRLESVRQGGFRQGQADTGVLGPGLNSCPNRC